MITNTTKKPPDNNADTTVIIPGFLPLDPPPGIRDIARLAAGDPQLALQAASVMLTGKWTLEADDVLDSWTCRNGPFWIIRNIPPYSDGLAMDDYCAGIHYWFCGVSGGTVARAVWIKDFYKYGNKIKNIIHHREAIKAGWYPPEVEEVRKVFFVYTGDSVLNTLKDIANYKNHEAKHESRCHV
jgi:hypothetical protein